MADIFRTAVGYPIGFTVITNIGSFVVVAADQQNEGIFFVFPQPVDDTITHLGFRNNSKTGTPADDTYTISLQSLDGSGIPNGILGGGSPASQTFPNATYPAAGFGSGTYHWIQLANSIAIQGGTDYGVVVQKTGASDASNFLTPTYGTDSYARCRKPYVGTINSSGTFAKDTGAFHTTWGVRGTNYYHMPAPTWGSNQAVGATAEAGFSFTIPSNFGTNTFGLRGIRLQLGSTGMVAAGSFYLTLYTTPTGSATKVQQTAAVDSDAVMSTTNAGTIDIMFPEDSMTALSPGTKYGIGFVTTGANGASVTYGTASAAADLAAYPFGGFPLITRTLATSAAIQAPNETTSFSETSGSFVFAELLLGSITVPAGSGGGIRIAGHGGLAA